MKVIVRWRQDLSKCLAMLVRRLLRSNLDETEASPRLDWVVKGKAGRFCLAWWTSLPCESHGFSENVNTCQLTKKTP